MTEPKILFVKQFLATLCEQEIRTIPINNCEFKAGVQEMANYYNDNIDKFGVYADGLRLLFLKYTTRGEFTQFSRIIESFNGRIVSLENPHYVKANLKLESEYVQDLVENDELGIAHEQYQNLVKSFCEGASLL